MPPTMPSHATATSACRAAIHAARARTEAVRLNRLGEFGAARHALRGVGRRIDNYAGSDAAL